MEIKKALRLLLNDYYGGLNDYAPVDKMQSSEKVDALEVIINLVKLHIFRTSIVILFSIDFLN